MLVHVRIDPKHPKWIVIDNAEGKNTAGWYAGDAATMAKPVSTEQAVGDNDETSQQQENMAEILYSATPALVDQDELNKLPQWVQKIVLTIMKDEDQDGMPDIMERSTGLDVSSVSFHPSGHGENAANFQSRIAKLDQLRESGTINAGQYEMLRALLEKASKK